VSMWLGVSRAAPVPRVKLCRKASHDSRGEQRLLGVIVQFGHSELRIVKGK